MRTTWRAVAGLVLLLLPVAFPLGGDAAAVVPGRFVTGWIPVWSSSSAGEGLRGVNTAEGVLAEVSPFAFSATDITELPPKASIAAIDAVVTALRAKKLPVIPSITDGTGKLVMAGILANPISRSQHADAIVQLVMAKGYDGIDLDYEGFAFADGRSSWSTTRGNWALFIQELGAKLHQNGKLLSMTVPPIWNNGLSGYAVYAWNDPATLAAVDRLRLMVYDWSFSSAGPLAPMSWVNDVIAYTTSVVPVEQRRKVQLGVPTYGRSWATVQSGVCPTSTDLSTSGVQMEYAAGLAASKGATPTRDSSGEMTFSYTVSFTGPRTTPLPPPTYTPPPFAVDTVAAAADGTALRPAQRLNPGGRRVTCVVKRTVFYPDEYAVVTRANAALSAGMSGIAIWALGYETTELWPQLAGIDVLRPVGTVPIGSLDSATLIGDGSAGVMVSGWVLDPEFDLPISITVTITNPGQLPVTSGPIIARSLRSDLPDVITGADPLHGFTSAGIAIRTLPGATVCVTATGFGAAASRVPVGSCRSV